MWHGIVVDAAFTDPSFLNSLNTFATKTDADWTITGIVIDDADFEAELSRIQKGLRKDAPFYLHFYRDQELVVVFAAQTFRVSTNRDSWAPILAYAATLSIPEQQLDFVPRSIEEETAYFGIQGGLVE